MLMKSTSLPIALVSLLMIMDLPAKDIAELQRLAASGDAKAQL